MSQSRKKKTKKNTYIYAYIIKSAEEAQQAPKQSGESDQLDWNKGTKNLSEAARGFGGGKRVEKGRTERSLVCKRFFFSKANNTWFSTV